MLNPLTGTRAPAATWTRNCIIPTRKGTYMAARSTEDPDKLKVFRNVDTLKSPGLRPEVYDRMRWAKGHGDEPDADGQDAEG